MWPSSSRSGVAVSGMGTCPKAPSVHRVYSTQGTLYSGSDESASATETPQVRRVMFGCTVFARKKLTRLLLFETGWALPTGVFQTLSEGKGREKPPWGSWVVVADALSDANTAPLGETAFTV